MSGRRFRDYSLRLLAALLFVLPACSPASPPPEAQPAASPVPPPDVEVTLARVDGAPIESGTKTTTGRSALVEGTVSQPKVIVCVVVHPMSGDTWWVQNLPSPPDSVDGKWHWRTTALFGTPQLGLNEDFELVAFAESTTNLCVNGKTFKTPDFPKSLPRSRVLAVKRDRS